MNKKKLLGAVLLIICICGLFLISACESKKLDVSQGAATRRMEIKKTADERDKMKAIFGATWTAEYERMSDSEKHLHDFVKTPQYERNRATWTAEAWDRKLHGK